MNSTAPPGIPTGPHLDLRNSYGAILLGAFASVGLLGITTLQAWLYYSRYDKDPTILKLTVAAVWIIEFIRSSFGVHASYHYAILEWGNLSALLTVVWSIDAIVFMTNMGELFGHLYFAWRVKILSNGRLILPSIIVFFTISNFALGVTTFVLSNAQSVVSQRTNGPSSVLSSTALCTAIATDVTITLSLIFLLNRSRTGFSKTNRLINTLIFYAINIGAITSVTDIVVLVLNRLVPETGQNYVAIYEIVGNFYANSFLASLNARASLRSQDNDFQLSSLNAAPGSAAVHDGIQFGLGKKNSTTDSNTDYEASPGHGAMEVNLPSLHPTTFSAMTGDLEDSPMSFNQNNRSMDPVYVIKKKGTGQHLVESV